MISGIQRTLVRELAYASRTHLVPVGIKKTAITKKYNQRHVERPRETAAPSNSGSLVQGSTARVFYTRVGAPNIVLRQHKQFSIKI